MTWMMTGSNRVSEAKVTRLVKEVLSAEDFSIQDLDGFNAHTEMAHFDSSEAGLDDSDIFRKDGWRETAAEILVPTREKIRAGMGSCLLFQGSSTVRSQLSFVLLSPRQRPNGFI